MHTIDDHGRLDMMLLLFPDAARLPGGGSRWFLHSIGPRPFSAIRPLPARLGGLAAVESRRGDGNRGGLETNVSNRRASRRHGRSHVSAGGTKPRLLSASEFVTDPSISRRPATNYDLHNELTSASDPNSAYAFAYNGDGQVTSTDNAGTPSVPDVVLTNAYDLMGDRGSQSATIAGTADYLNSYSYNGDQQLTVLQQQDQNGGDVISPKEVDLAYNALGQFTSIVDFNTLTAPRTDVATGSYGYDGDSRLTSLAYTSDAGASTIDSLNWGFDDASNVTSFSSDNGTATYGYDPTNQLTSATYTTASGGHQPANESYSFDSNGNRNSSGYTTTSPNLMSSDGTYDYQHDADGNTISRTQIGDTYSTQYKTTYTWDYRNRLTDVEYYDNNNVLTEHVHYVYGVFDHLLATEVDTTGDGTYTEIEHWVLDVSPEIPQAGVPGTALAQPVFEFNGNQDLAIRYLQAVDRIFTEEAVTSPSQGGTDSWDLVNNLGSVIYVLNNTGAVIDQLVYNAFGVVAYESSPSTDHFAGFAGGHVDPTTELVNEDHRWYNPANGEWESQDPAGFSAGDGDLSRYVGNDATTFVDASGLKPWPPKPIVSPNWPNPEPGPAPLTGPGSLSGPSPFSGPGSGFNQPITNLPAQPTPANPTPISGPLDGINSVVPSSFTFGPNESGAITGGQMESSGFMADRFGGAPSFYAKNQTPFQPVGTIISGQFVIGGWLAKRLGGWNSFYAGPSAPPTVTPGSITDMPAGLPPVPNGINIHVPGGSGPAWWMQFWFQGFNHSEGTTFSLGGSYPANEPGEPGNEEPHVEPHTDPGSGNPPMQQ